jgi:pimeloyl-ACP methyl ester carboxylesterase/tetratricopeptide (TPR) repeat protein
VLYGRDRERDEIRAVLDGARISRSAALVVRGEAGIGKTALLQDARDRATDMHVLAVRGVQSEAELPFAGLHQLLRPALNLIDQIPVPQARALSGALGLGERSGDDRFLISVASLTLLSELAERRPVLCLVDDAQWLDTPSSDALLFVARRLDAEGIAMLFAVRENEEDPFVAERLPELILRGLEPSAAGELVDRTAGHEVPAAVRDRLVDQAAGNALALLELPSALTRAQLAGRDPLPDSLPLTHDVEAIYLERVRRLPEPTQQLLLLAAADSTGRLAPILRAASSFGVDADALADAERAGLVTVSVDGIEFKHPLVRSAVYQGTLSGTRRAAHGALADALDESEADQRAWHRAAASLGPDEALAEELERTADRARLRGGYAAAAAALERAADLTPQGGDVARRLVAAAAEAWQAGQPDRVAATLRRAGHLTEPRLRAESDHLLGLLGLRRGNLLEAGATLIDGASAVAPFDPHKAFEMLVDAGSVAGRSGDSARTVEIGRLVAGLPSSDDPEDALLRDLLVGVGSLIEGKAADAVPLIADAVSRANDSADTRLLSWAATGASTIGDQRSEGQLLHRAMAVARETGAADTLVLILETFTSSAVLSGRLDFDAEATEGLELAREAGLANAAMSHLAALAWAAALRGQEDECRRLADAVAESVQTNALANAHTVAQWSVALLDLGIGRPEDAVARLSALAAAPVGVLQPFFVLMFTPDLVEACVRTGRLAEGRDAFAILDAFTSAAAPTWALAFAARCRALLAEDSPESEALLDESLRLHAESNRPFDTARTELLFGEHLRRRRKRLEAREHLKSALETFERMGVTPWIERARSELRASGETARRRDPTTLVQLTPQELQVARFVAEGLSNKEVAARLFLSPGRSTPISATCSRSSASPRECSSPACRSAPTSHSQRRLGRNPVERPFEVEVDGGVLVGRRVGSGPPALVLHGGPALPDYTAPCAAELGAAFTTIRYAQRGVAPSTVGAPYSVDAHVGDAVAVLDELGLDRAWVTGHSWGGHLALHVAVAHPERIEGVVCINPLGASLEPLADFKENLLRGLPPDRRAWVEEVDAREDVGTATKEESLEAFRTIWPSYFADPGSASPFPFETLGDGGGETWASITEHVERRTLDDGLPKVVAPTLFIHGEVDPLPVRCSTDTAALMPNANVVILDGCGHFPWLEQPGELRRVVADTLSGSGGETRGRHPASGSE